jgi:hypothetical protein
MIEIVFTVMAIILFVSYALIGIIYLCLACAIVAIAVVVGTSWIVAVIQFTTKAVKRAVRGEYKQTNQVKK